MPKQMLDVIVIGCGASGIAALRKLHDAGLKVLGLEGLERLGGRIATEKFADGVVDIGAAWCHGEKDNIVFEIANPLGLLGRPAPDNKWFVMSNGEFMPNEEGERILGALNEEVAKADKENAMSILDCVKNAAKSNEILTSNPVVTNSFIEWFERNNHLGGQDDPRTGKSLKGLLESWGCEGEAMLNWKGRGYKTILDVLLNRYPDPSKEIPVEILLNKEVEGVKWKSTQGLGALVQVKCKDGSLYVAKSVVVTASVGVLKERHETFFNPPLPAEKVTAINTLQMCVLDKIYVEFDRPWWPGTPANFTVLWRDEDKATFSDEHKWITEIFGLQTVDYQPNVLLVWIYGKGAEQMEQTSVEGVRAGVDKLLEFLFKKRYDVTPVKDILRTKWKANKLARGTYAYRSVYTEVNGGSARILSEPLCNAGFPAVCFAGEATSLHRHSAVHGAVEAGFREAKRIIDSYKTLG